MSHTSTTNAAPRYEPPTLVVLGPVHVLTQDGKKAFGTSDGWHFIDGEGLMTVSS